MSEQPKWTPGPWLTGFSPNSEGFDDLRVAAGQKCVVGGCGCCGSPFGDNLWDLYLIAAAPDLYAALEAFDKFENDCHYGDFPPQALYDAARAALAKARGK